MNRKSGVVPIKTAAAVLGVDIQTLRLMLQHQQADFGIAFKRNGSTRFSYIIYAEPFYHLTGYRAGSEVSE